MLSIFNSESEVMQMRRVVVDMQNALFADAIATALQKFDSDFEVCQSDSPAKTTDLCVFTEANILIMEVTAYTPWKLEERMKIRGEVKAQNPDCKIYVNVHKVKGDSLVWNRLERTSLPSIFNVVNSQQSAKSGNTVYCLTKYDNRYCMASSDDPVAGEWSKTEVTLAFNPVVSSLSATDDALYILDNSKQRTRSTDGLKIGRGTARALVEFAFALFFGHCSSL